MQYRLVDIIEKEKMVDIGIEIGRNKEKVARLYDQKNKKYVEGKIKHYKLEYETVGIDPMIVDEYPVLELVIYPNGNNEPVKYRIKGVTEYYKRMIEKILGKDV